MLQGSLHFLTLKVRILKVLTLCESKATLPYTNNRSHNEPSLYNSKTMMYLFTVGILWHEEFFNCYIHSLITPVGIGIGIAVTESSNIEGSFVAILQALAAGTLVYVVFFEVLEKERVKKQNFDSKKQLWCQLYGVIQVKLQNEFL